METLIETPRRHSRQGAAGKTCLLTKMPWGVLNIENRKIKYTEYSLFRIVFPYVSAGNILNAGFANIIDLFRILLFGGRVPGSQISTVHLSRLAVAIQDSQGVRSSGWRHGGYCKFFERKNPR
jgi:hypothetical protein